MNGRGIDIDTRIRGPTVFLSLFPKCFQPAAKAPGMPQDSSMLNNRVKCAFCSVSFSLVPFLCVSGEPCNLTCNISDSGWEVQGRARGGEGGGRERTSWCVFFLKRS